MARCKKTDMLVGAIKKAGGGKVQTSSDTARKLAKEMGGMKKGGGVKPQDPISRRPTTPSGRPVTMRDLEKSNRDTGGMTAAEIKAIGEAIRRANNTPYEPIPKKAIGGVQRLPTRQPVQAVKAAPMPRREKREMMPVRRAKGGAGKVRKGMMSETGDIQKAVKPKKGIGGIM